MSLSVSPVKSTNYQPSFGLTFKVEQPGLTGKAVSLLEFTEPTLRQVFGGERRVITPDLTDIFVAEALRYKESIPPFEEVSSVLVFQPKGILTESGLSMRHDSSNRKLNEIRVGIEQADLLRVIREGNLFEYLGKMYYELGATILDCVHQIHPTKSKKVK